MTIRSQVLNLFIVFIVKILNYIRVQYIIIIARERVFCYFINYRYYPLKKRTC